MKFLPWIIFSIITQDLVWVVYFTCSNISIFNLANEMIIYSADEDNIILDNDYCSLK